ncbi:MAG: ABC transporter permease [Rickettsiales bacterium]|nr:ABC transporter permease [Rickettsiales bacterium]
MQGINWIGLRTVYLKETRRFLKVYNQTLFAPVVTSMLFLAFFSLAIGDKVAKIANIDFAVFMSSGLIMMTVMQNAFANSSSSFTMGKVLGILVDYLMPPLSPGEIIAGMVAACITRGLLVGILIFITVSFFVPISIEHPLIALYYIITASVLLALLGILGGILAETFDQMSAITSYIITPLSFLSGTFYSVQNLPPLWYHISHYNPFFYLIDGFRYGMTGYSDGSITTGVFYTLGCVVVLWSVNWYLMTRGYRIKD